MPNVAFLMIYLFDKMTDAGSRLSYIFVVIDHCLSHLFHQYPSGPCKIMDNERVETGTV